MSELRGKNKQTWAEWQYELQEAAEAFRIWMNENVEYHTEKDHYQHPNQALFDFLKDNSGCEFIFSWVWQYENFCRLTELVKQQGESYSSRINEEYPYKAYTRQANFFNNIVAPWVFSNSNNSPDFYFRERWRFRYGLRHNWGEERKNEEVAAFNAFDVACRAARTTHQEKGTKYRNEWQELMHEKDGESERLMMASYDSSPVPYSIETSPLQRTLGDFEEATRKNRTILFIQDYFGNNLYCSRRLSYADLILLENKLPTVETLGVSMREVELLSRDELIMLTKIAPNAVIIPNGFQEHWTNKMKYVHSLSKRGVLSIDLNMVCMIHDVSRHKKIASNEILAPSSMSMLIRLLSLPALPADLMPMILSYLLKKNTLILRLYTSEAFKRASYADEIKTGLMREFILEVRKFAEQCYTSKENVVRPDFFYFRIPQNLKQIHTLLIHERETNLYQKSNAERICREVVQILVSAKNDPRSNSDAMNRLYERFLKSGLLALDMKEEDLGATLLNSI